MENQNDNNTENKEQEEDIETSLVKDRTFNEINDELHRVLRLFTNKQQPAVIIEKIAEKLQGNYVFVAELFQLRKGRFVRWVDENGVFSRGGIVADIVFKEAGVWILCKSYYGQFFQYRYDNTLTFQKMNALEKLYLELQE